MKWVLVLVAMLTVGCSLPRLMSEDMPVSDSKKQCMELAELTCAKAETCHDLFDWNDCMLSMYTAVCIHVDEVGPGYMDCYRAISSMECGGQADESCSKAFIQRVSTKELENES